MSSAAIQRRLGSEDVHPTAAPAKYDTIALKAHDERKRVDGKHTVPSLIKILTPSGLESVSYTASSLADAAPYEPRDGVYTITNTYHKTRVLNFDAHLDRMENSARLSGTPIQLDRGKIRAALREMIETADFGDVRFRITAAPSLRNNLILSMEPFKPLAPEVYSTGIRVITLPHAARTAPDAKTTDWMLDRRILEDSLPPGIFTGLLIGESGKILEGLSSNFYAVLDNKLRTSGASVLPGMAQKVVFAIAEQVLPLIKIAVTMSDIPKLSEAFITSASRGIVPVIEIDGTPVGTGIPGAKTAALRGYYQKWVDVHLEAL